MFLMINLYFWAYSINVHTWMYPVLSHAAVYSGCKNVYLASHVRGNCIWNQNICLHINICDSYQKALCTWLSYIQMLLILQLMTVRLMIFHHYNCAAYDMSTLRWCSGSPYSVVTKLSNLICFWTSNMSYFQTCPLPGTTQITQFEQILDKPINST